MRANGTEAGHETHRSAQGQSRAGLAAVIGFALLAGCADPLLKDTEDRSPQLLVPLAHSAVRDGRARFREIFCAVRDDHGQDLPDDRPCDQALAGLMNEGAPSGRPVHLGAARMPLTVVVVPGIFGECVVRDVPPLEHARNHIEDHGYGTAMIPVSGRFGTAHNARMIAEQIPQVAPGDSRDLVLVGYSKGLPDILVALAEYPGIRGRVAAVVSVAGVVSGTPLADGFRDTALGNAAERLPHSDCAPGDGLAISDLSRSTRMAWLQANRSLLQNDLPATGIRFYSVVGFPRPDQISRILRPFHGALSQVDPRNDSQMVFSDAVLPTGTLLGYVQADHWAVTLPFSRNQPTVAATLVTRNRFPREVLLEAIVRNVEEDLLRR